jgi:hypothetical protein
MFMFAGNGSLAFHLGTFCKFQSSFIYGRLNLLTKNIAIISSMRIRIMPFTISMFLSCSGDGMTLLPDNLIYFSCNK